MNSKTRIPKGPIPRKDEIIDAMQGAHWFSCLDLLSGYYQLGLKEAHRQFTAFSTPKGHFEYLVTAQGLAGAPSTFNRFVREMFKDLEDIARVYFDDLYVHTRSKDVKVHIEAIDRVLKRCEERGLRIKLSKCVFLAAEIPVLGDLVGREGVRMDPERVEAIASWPTPRTRRELERFLGTIVYCQRFCENYGRLVAPLQLMVKGKRKGDALTFTPEQFKAFEALKEAMTRTPVLAIPDHSKPFGIRMDACDYALGGVLYQEDELGDEHPVAYTGRKLASAEIHYPMREKELLAIIHALRVWRPYLLDHAFVVETDHQSLQDLLTQRTCSQRLARWLDFLSQYRPEFKWIEGKTNVVADGLSRRADFVPAQGSASHVNLKELLESILNASSEGDGEQILQDAKVFMFHDLDQCMVLCYALLDVDLADLCRAGYEKDPTFAEAWAFFRQGEGNGLKISSFGMFTCENKLLWVGQRLCVPNAPNLHARILFSEHDDPSRGHPGTYKTLQFVKAKYYWKNMDRKIRDYVKSCEKCQRNKHRQTKPPGLLHPLRVPDARWQHITMDFITGLPPSEGYNAIWVIMDRLTKRGHFIPLAMKDNLSAAVECAQVFCDRYQRLHGIPESVVSDRDTRFTSTFWATWMELQETRLCTSSAFRPNTDGQSERTNRFLEDYLRNYVHPTQDNWSKFLFLAEIAYNSRQHDAIRMAPFEADLGYIPRTQMDHVLGNLQPNTGDQEAIDFNKRQQEVVKWLKQSLEEANERMKQYYDRNRPIQLFKEGDQVLLSTKNLDVEHLGIHQDASKKLGPLWIGPYRVLKQTTPDTYELELPKGLRLHSAFHTSLLKPYHQDHDAERSNRPNEGMIAAGGFENGFLVEKIVGHRETKARGKEVCVKWVGYPSSENTWEPIEHVLKPAGDLLNDYIRKKRLSLTKWTGQRQRGKRKRR